MSNIGRPDSLVGQKVRDKSVPPTDIGPDSLVGQKVRDKSVPPTE